MRQIIKLIALSVAITALCCYAAYRERGYIAAGGEWLAWMVIVALYLSRPAEAPGE